MYRCENCELIFEQTRKEKTGVYLNDGDRQWFEEVGVCPRCGYDVITDVVRDRRNEEWVDDGRIFSDMECAEIEEELSELLDRHGFTEYPHELITEIDEILARKWK